MRRRLKWSNWMMLLEMAATISNITVGSKEIPNTRSASLDHGLQMTENKKLYFAVDNDDEVEQQSGWFGRGREFTLFEGVTNRNNKRNSRIAGQDSIGDPSDSIGGRENIEDGGDERDDVGGGKDTAARRISYPSFRKTQRTAYKPVSSYSTSPSSSPYSTPRGRSGRSPGGGGDGYLFFQPVSDWWTRNISPNIMKNLPKIRVRVEPTTTLKIRKTFRPLKTIVKLGAYYNTQLGVWQFKSSWEDAIIGGKLTLAGKELQLSKSWQLSVGAMEDLVTRLRFRAAVDLSTWKAYMRVGFRTERLAAINVMEGFTLLKQVPLDGQAGNIKLEVRANFALPEPEIEYSTESQRSLVGMGDIEVNLEELNLLLDY